MRSGPDPAELLPAEDLNWRPGPLAAWWAGLAPVARGLLRKRVNPHNETRLHLAKLIARRPDRIAVGAWTYGRPKVRFAESGAKLTIGRYGSIADGVEILLGGNHRTDWATTYPFPEWPELWPGAERVEGSHATRGDVSIGHDVWLGSQCMILSGVRVGTGAVVAARAVVTRDVPPYAVVGGNPARALKSRFDEPTVEALLASRWWMLPREAVTQLLPLLMSERTGDLLAAIATHRGTGS